MFKMKCDSLCVLSQPFVSYYTSVSKNSPDQFVKTKSPSVLKAHDKKLVKILEDFNYSKTTSENANLSDESRLGDYFCLDTGFHLSNTVLSDREIKILEKSLDCAPISS